MFDPSYLGVALLGLLHGFEPGHGWPMAVLYAMRRKNPVVSATVSSTIIGLGHLVSSIAVVLAYVLLQAWLDFDAPWLKYAAAALLVFLAVRLWNERVENAEKDHGHSHDGNQEIEHEHEHEHPRRSSHNHRHSHKSAAVLTLAGLAAFAFILGFAHEEEIALLALVAGGLNAWVLMLTYGLCVLLGLVAVTVTGVKVYQRFKPKMERFEKYVPKISAGLLVLMAIAIIVF